jgi:hypothetical protein
MKTLLASAAVLAIALPAASALAHDDDYYLGDFYHRQDHREHERFHEQFDAFHEHERGFNSEQEHRDWHRAYQQTHRDFHDDRPDTWDDQPEYRQYRYQPYRYPTNGWYPAGGFWFDFFNN